MNKYFLLFLLLLANRGFGQKLLSSAEFNFGFEKTLSKEKVPSGWAQWGSGYKIQVDTDIKHSGKASVMIKPNTDRVANSFGCIAYSIPAVFNASEIELRAYLKLKNVDSGRVELMLRIDGTSGVLAFENLEKKNINGTKDWSIFSVKLPYPEDAKTIYVGAILTGGGQLWADDFQVLIDGKDITAAEEVIRMHVASSDTEFDHGSNISALALNKAQVENLTILCKIWGFLKYYHPVVRSGQFNWDYELFRIIPKILTVTSQAERNEILKTWISSFGKVENRLKDNSENGAVKLSPDWSWINKTTLGKEMSSKLNTLKTTKRFSTNFYFEKSRSNHIQELKNEKSYESMYFPDTGYRLLSLFRYWNIINYYFPYKDLIGEDWDKVLVEYLPKFIDAQDELDYKLTVLSLISRIKDSHANIWGMDYILDGYKGKRYAPLQITFIENKAVVTGYLDESLAEKSGLRIGDVIESIDGKLVEEIITERLPITPGSNIAAQMRDIARDLLRTNKSILDIRYSNGVDTLTTRIETFSPIHLGNFSMRHKQDTCFLLLNDQIAYLYAGLLKNRYLPTIMGQIQTTKALILDLRCYPADPLILSLGKYLLPKERSFAKFSKPNLKNPGVFTFSEEIKIGSLNPDYFKGKVIILVNEDTQSSAEFHAMAFATAPNATILGSTTAGADGDVLKFFLPGGISTMMSGVGVYYPNGTDTQRIGIVPDIQVKPTIKGIRMGKDELIEKAVEGLNLN